MFGRRRAWRDLEPAERAVIVLGGVAQIALQAAMLLDLHRRTSDELNGSRKAGVWLSFVNFLGPIAYFLAGRSRSVRIGVGSSR